MTSATAPSPAKLAGQALSRVKDPELGVDIVALGLVYGIEAEPYCVRVVMTMTFPGCPMSGLITDMVEQVLGATFPEWDVVVATTDDPPWNPAMLSPEGRAWLGL